MSAYRYIFHHCSDNEWLTGTLGNIPQSKLLGWNVISIYDNNIPKVCGRCLEAMPDIVKLAWKLEI